MLIKQKTYKGKGERGKGERRKGKRQETKKPGKLVTELTGLSLY